MKTSVILFFCFLALNCFSQSLTDSLVVYYPFNGNALDCSGHDYHGMTNAEFVPDHNGEPYSALHFNGADQYLEFPVNRPALKPDLPVSFAFRVMFEDLYVTKTYLFDTDYDQNNHSGIWANLTPDNHLTVSYGDASEDTGPYNRRTAISYSSIETRTWYFVILVLNGPYDMEIYINCENQDVWYDGNGEGLGYTDCQGNIGRIDGSVGVSPYYFIGALDDFRYWNRALTTDDIDALCMQDNLTEDDQGILSYPNPAGDFIFLSNTPNSIKYIEINDMTGRQIKLIDFNSFIDVSDLTPGNYLARLCNPDNTVIKAFQFVKN